MYEKPQYPTPDGYRRLGKNPNDPDNKNSLTPKRLLSLNNRNQSQPQKTFPTPLEIVAQARKVKNSTVTQKQPLLQRKGISDKAAQLIAMAIKDMLKS